MVDRFRMRLYVQKENRELAQGFMRKFMERAGEGQFWKAWKTPDLACLDFYEMPAGGFNFLVSLSQTPGIPFVSHSWGSFFYPPTACAADGKGGFFHTPAQAEPDDPILVELTAEGVPHEQKLKMARKVLEARKRFGIGWENEKEEGSNGR